VGDLFLTELPAQLDRLAIAIGGEVDQPFQRALELDAKAVQGDYRLKALMLGAARSVARLLIALSLLGRRTITLGFVLGDAGLVLELWEQRRQLRNLRNDPLHAWKLRVCFLDRVGAEPLHRTTI